MTITIINDCSDPNAVARQSARTSSLHNNASIVSLPVTEYSEIQAAGNLIDVIDAYEDRQGIILVNVAPRHGKAKKWPNGTPFGYFNYKNLLIVTTIDGLVLSLVKKFDLAEEIRVFDIPKVLSYLENIDLSIKSKKDRITNSQFRSFDFEPLASKWLKDGLDLPYESLETDEIKNIEDKVWFIDNYGNCKTTILPEDIDFKVGNEIDTAFGKLRCYYRLKDVPNNERALIIGSSGIDDKRFLEIVVQGQSAKKVLNINIGDKILQ